MKNKLNASTELVYKVIYFGIKDDDIDENINRHYSHSVSIV